VHSKDKDVPAVSLTFVASSLQEKSSWCSDISQVRTAGYSTIEIFSTLFSAIS